MRASGLMQLGSVVRWHYRLRLLDNDATDGAVRALTAAAQAQLPEAGWEVRTRANASPALERNVERFTQFLTLVGLAALLVGGVGVANAVKGHLDRRRDTIATLKSLGATGSRVFAIYLTQVVALAALGAVPGLAVGAAMPFLISWGFGAVLPLPLAPALHPGDLALALLYGLLTAVAFALWPLGRAHDVPVSALFRDEVAGEQHWPRTPYIVATVLVGCALATLAIGLAYRQAHRRALRRDRHRRARAAAPGGGAAHGRGAAPAAPALAGAAARHRQYPPAGRDHAERGAVARPGAWAARHRARDRRQPAPAVPGGAAGQGAGLLLHRHPGAPTPGNSTPSSASARRARRSTACPCCAGASSPPTACRPQT